ncbi:SUMF1/EgtB/PvdO family nonheme iron enzyme [Crocinitomicaceae bacterium]|nr:SUMF1/EgtB/PvdO family nonheme iron enzyme [Crocinitomicaceae bacterium]MDB3906413.1 SUMF1/EgtB/PvdO family nonheme iron enzyme [Crocinitomicaceae bacterium]
MKKRSLFLLLFLGAVASSCASHRIIHPHAKNTPGTLPINEVLLVDKTEATNFNWVEYMFWTKRVYGSHSQEYLSTLPDTLVWSELNCDTVLQDYYLRHPSYRHHPVAGITQTQAKAYSQWRSDRVFEYHLIKEGIIHFNGQQSSENYFTIANYFEGKYKDLIPDGDSSYLVPVDPDLSLKYPEYRLPNAEDRLMILDYVDSTDFQFHQKNEKKYNQWREDNLPFHLAHTPCGEDSTSIFVTREADTYKDPNGKFALLHNTRGNVAEWGDEENVTYGGGWPHNVEYVLSKDSISIERANSWTGFRNVCEWKKWEE